MELSSPAVVQRVAERLEGYRVSADAVEALRETLKEFVGTKNYHNYTNHKQPTDPSCNRWATLTEVTAAAVVVASFFVVFRYSVSFGACGEESL